MDFAAVVRARRMVRTYDPAAPVPRPVLEGLLDLALRAPSAGHTQGREFVVLSTPEDVERFWAVTAPGGTRDAWLQGMATAPVLVIVLSDPERYLHRYAEADKARVDVSVEWPVPYWDVDAGMAAHTLLLAAVDAGLGACFFGVPGPRHAAVAEAFGLPADRRIVGVVSLGHPAPDRRSPSLRRGRRPVGETVHYGRFTPS